LARIITSHCWHSLDNDHRRNEKTKILDFRGGLPKLTTKDILEFEKGKKLKIGKIEKIAPKRFGSFSLIERVGNNETVKSLTSHINGERRYGQRQRKQIPIRVKRSATSSVAFASAVFVALLS
jgi:hypothetical protein